jgi:outer membrane lipopolysaccharide assembly protein LptE/RlpB
MKNVRDIIILLLLLLLVFLLSGCKHHTRYGAPQCMYGWLLGSTDQLSSSLYVSKD